MQNKSLKELKDILEAEFSRVPLREYGITLAYMAEFLNQESSKTSAALAEELYDKIKERHSDFYDDESHEPSE